MLTAAGASAGRGGLTLELGSIETAAFEIKQQRSGSSHRRLDNYSAKSTQTKGKQS